MNKRLLIGLVLLTLIRLAFAGRTELLPEEAYYWTYTQHPAWSYFDHPPMVAWMIHCGTMLFGNTEFGVRLGNILLAVASCWLLVKVAEMWFDQRVAEVAGWMFLLAPVFVGMGFLAMPDAPLLFFWLITLYAVTRALVQDRAGWWWLAGIGFGGAMLSKYYAVLLAPSLLVFLVMSPRYRAWLKRPEPWLAVVLALALFSPVIFWNSQNHWASFAFQSTRTVGQHASGLAQFGLFCLMQVALPTPVLFVLFVLTAARGVRQGWGQERAERWNFAVAFSLPLLALFAVASTKGAFRMNWTAPAFLSLLPAAAAVLVEFFGKSRGWRWAAGVTTVACVAIIAWGHFELATMKFLRFGGWRQLAAQVKVEKAELAAKTGQKPFVLGADKYNLAAEVGFYSQDPSDCVNPFALGAQGLGYRYWTNLERFRGCPAVIVMLRSEARDLEKIRSHFERLDIPKLVRIYNGNRLQREVHLVTGYGYRPEHPDGNL
jgi:dolichol-phosphate mannosyltransferase